MVDISGWNQRKKKDWCYLDIESARRPIPHCAEVPVPVFTSLPNLIADEMLVEAMDDTDSSDSSISSFSRKLLLHLCSVQNQNPLIKAN